LWLLMFLAGGSLRYWQGWLFWLHFACWTLGGTIYFLRYDPALVERRLRAGPTAETQPAQKRIQLFISAVMIVMFLVAGLDHRFGWSALPPWGVIAGHILIAAGYAILFAVFRSNSFAASTVEVHADQRVVSTGLYGIVRHPMYVGAIVLFTGVPLTLGSLWAVLAIFPLLIGLALRLLDEEAYLSRNLPGYADYMRKVRYHLLPFVW
jgi:protein-S-isoprenylcysteine O-methyltransferase Ste14